MGLVAAVAGAFWALRQAHRGEHAVLRQPEPQICACQLPKEPLSVRRLDGTLPKCICAQS